MKSKLISVQPGFCNIGRSRVVGGAEAIPGQFPHQVIKDIIKKILVLEYSQFTGISFG